MRWKLTVQYDGQAFFGWQSQQGVSTAQDALEKALAGLCQCAVHCHVAGRTDRGVHALGQVVHVDLPRDLRPDRMRLAIQAHLEGVPMAIVQAERVDDRFHARFSATMRHYRYRIIQAPFPPVLSAQRAWWVAQELDMAAMQLGANHLLGSHDFSSFRASGCQAQHALRSLDRAVWSRIETDYAIELYAEFSARSFLYHQVRNMVGTLVEVGLGRRAPEDIATLLAACDRTLAGRTAPAHGLYFLGVDYP